MRRLLVSVVVVVLVCAGVCSVGAANRVIVESKTIGINATGLPIHVMLENDVALRGLVVPLVLREITPGAYVSAMRLRWSDRLPPGSSVLNTRFNNIYSEPDNACGQGGFGTATSNDTLNHPVAASPECGMFAAIQILGDQLEPGQDVTGSLIIEVEVTGTSGVFEIDTTCTAPMNHLEFVPEQSQGDVFAPLFQKGTITIVGNTLPVAQCMDVTVPAGAGCVAATASIDDGSYDPDGDVLTLIQDPQGPYPLGTTPVRLHVYDANAGHSFCDGNVTVIDQTPPELICHADTVVRYDPLVTETVVEFEVIASDECSAASVVCTPPSGSVFPVGITEVFCVATDASLNVNECSFLVVVEPPSGYCNYMPEDINCDGFIDATDLNLLIDVLFFGRPPSTPCCHIEE